MISDWTGYLLDVVDRRIAFEAGDAIRVTEDEVHDLLLFVGSSTLTAVGGEGVAWTTTVPDADDMKVVRIEPRGIVCTCWVLGEPVPEFVIDPATGARL